MDSLETIDHNLNISDRIKVVDKYYQFSDTNLSTKNNDKVWRDVLESILFQLDSTFNLLCLKNDKTEITNYMMGTRSKLMDDFISRDLYKKNKYNSRSGINKTSISVNLETNKTNQSGLIFYSDYFMVNIIIVDRHNKKFHYVKPPLDELHYIMINVDNTDDKEEYLPPLTINDYLFKKDDLSSYIENFAEVELSNISNSINSSVKNINNIYKTEKVGNKITDFKLADLQGMACSHSIPLTNTKGKKKTKAELFKDLTGKF
jgi:hypothetical protein